MEVLPCSGRAVAELNVADAALEAAQVIEEAKTLDDHRSATTLNYGKQLISTITMIWAIWSHYNVAQVICGSTA